MTGGAELWTKLFYLSKPYRGELWMSNDGGS